MQEDKCSAVWLIEWAGCSIHIVSAFRRYRSDLHTILPLASLNLTCSCRSDWLGSDFLKITRETESQVNRSGCRMRGGRCLSSFSLCLSLLSLPCSLPLPSLVSMMASMYLNMRGDMGSPVREWGRKSSVPWGTYLPDEVHTVVSVCGPSSYSTCICCYAVWYLLCTQVVGRKQ